MRALQYEVLRMVVGTIKVPTIDEAHASTRPQGLLKTFAPPSASLVASQLEALTASRN